MYICKDIYTTCFHGLCTPPIPNVNALFLPGGQGGERPARGEESQAGTRRRRGWQGQGHVQGQEQGGCEGREGRKEEVEARGAPQELHSLRQLRGERSRAWPPVGLTRVSAGRKTLLPTTRGCWLDCTPAVRLSCAVRNSSRGGVCEELAVLLTGWRLAGVWSDCVSATRPVGARGVVSVVHRDWQSGAEVGNSSHRWLIAMVVFWGAPTAQAEHRPRG